jgi:hypothetical protein
MLRIRASRADAESVGCGVIADVSSENEMGRNNRATPRPLSQQAEQA